MTVDPTDGDTPSGGGGTPRTHGRRGLTCRRASLRATGATAAVTALGAGTYEVEARYGSAARSNAQTTDQITLTVTWRDGHGGR